MGRLETFILCAAGAWILAQLVGADGGVRVLMLWAAYVIGSLAPLTEAD